MSGTTPDTENVARMMARLTTRSVQHGFAELVRQRAVERRRGVLSVYRNADVTAAARTSTLHGTGAGGPSFGAARPLIPMDLDGAEHDRYLRVLAPLFSPREVRGYEPSTRTLAVDLLTPLVTAGRAEIVERFCRPLGSLSFLDMFGLPRTDLDFLLGFVRAVVHPRGRTPRAREEAAGEAGAAMYDYLGAAIRAQRPNGNSMLARLTRSEVDGRRLTTQELQDIGYVMIIAGIEMVSTALACILSWLARHPERRAELVADPDLVPGAVDELLRYESPTPAAARTATEDVRLPSGQLIEQGERVRLVWATANLDDTVFADPLDVDFTRAQRGTLAFGTGPHRCIGAALSRMQLIAALREFHRLAPDYHIDPGEPAPYFEFGIRDRLPLVFGGERT